MATVINEPMNPCKADRISEQLQQDDFIRRHIGPSDQDIRKMLGTVGVGSLQKLIQTTVPGDILSEQPLALPDPTTEHQALHQLREYAVRNRVFKSFLGMGYYGTLVPPVILRNVLENPGWYTAYTPYQSEISQGRLESLLNFQQMVMDLTGMEIANASLLDEATAAAEAMAMAKRAGKKSSQLFFVADDVHPQTLDVVKTRARYFGFTILSGPVSEFPQDDIFGALLQYPGSTGQIEDLQPFIQAAHEQQAIVAVACDLLSLTLLKPPGELGADIAIGNSQRFGVPMGFGGPHAAFFATREIYKRSLPGRIIGVSKDRRGQTALRMAMQTREQHIRRDKATSNICTAQALLANMAAFYAMYHGPQGLTTIASRVHTLTRILADSLTAAGYELDHESYFDTLSIQTDDQAEVLRKANQAEINLRVIDPHRVGVSLDETTTTADMEKLLEVFGASRPAAWESGSPPRIATELQRQSAFLEHPVFHQYQSETEMLRYLKRLENRDYSLTHGMIPLGSCTMKLNASVEMIPVTWPEFSDMHPFAPAEQWQGYRQMIEELENWLIEISGYDAVSLQPNSGAQGEYAGLLAIRRYHQSIGEGDRDICLIPSSAHGTNPASATMMGLHVVVVKTDKQGDIDLEDLKHQIEKYADRLSSLMITYPSTHGVFEESVREVCRWIHDAGGQVYLDGANMNAMVGVTSPGEIGADVSHMNLHKTFCIPHGGGGPGVGPIGVKKHLAPFLPDHGISGSGGRESEVFAVSAAPFGSAAILPISWAYIRMMGGIGLTKATQVAILNANYIAKRLDGDFEILYRGRNDRVAHECIVDIRPIKESTGVTEEDIAKRMMDYGFHAPTMSWPVPGTIMIEPTESESKRELDRFCEAMLSIREEIRAIESGRIELEDSPLRHAPHTLVDILDADWQRVYTRQQAVCPPGVAPSNKFWPAVNRVDNVYGDRNFACNCPPMSDYQTD